MSLRISGGKKSLFFPRNSIESHGTPIKRWRRLNILYTYIYLLDNIYHVGTRGRDKSGGRAHYNTVVHLKISSGGGCRGTRGTEKNCVIYVLSVWHQKIVSVCDTVGVRARVIYVINNFNGHPSVGVLTNCCCSYGADRPWRRRRPCRKYPLTDLCLLPQQRGEKKYIYYTHTHKRIWYHK